MRRRHFSLLAAATMANPAISFAQSEADIFGEYEDISPPQPTGAKGQVEVVEMFWYRCPHCYRFQPTITAYEKTLPEWVKFTRMPAVLSPQWRTQAQVFYTAKALKVLEKVHGPIFDAIHRDRRELVEQADIREFFGEHGVDGAKFDAAFASFGVDAQVRRAAQMSGRYGINGVPTMIVNGRYRTGATLTGSHGRVLEVVDTLAKMEGRRMGIQTN